MESIMGRKPTVNLNLPQRMRLRVRNGKTYYFYDAGGKPRREIALGQDYVLAIQKWAELHEAQPTAVVTVGWLIGKYLASPQFDDLGLGTQADYKFALDKLLSKFGDAPVDQVRSSHVQLYLDQRSQESRHRALREKAILSMLFNWGMARDYCKANPVAVIKNLSVNNVYVQFDLA